MFDPELSEAIRWFENNDPNRSTYTEKMGLILVDTVKDLFDKVYQLESGYDCDGCKYYKSFIKCKHCLRLPRNDLYIKE